MELIDEQPQDDEYANSDIVKENLRRLNAKGLNGRSMKENLLIDWRLTTRSLVSCVRCGGYITMPNFKFYHFDETKVLCYNCQKEISL